LLSKNKRTLWRFITHSLISIEDKTDSVKRRRTENGTQLRDEDVEIIAFCFQLPLLAVRFSGTRHRNLESSGGSVMGESSERWGGTKCS